jgi:predicted  nucleic acid-binding Zn-ribbon protein
MECKSFDKISAAAVTIMETSRYLQAFYNEEVDKLRNDLRRKEEELNEFSSTTQLKAEELDIIHNEECSRLQSLICRKDETIESLRKSLDESTAINKILETKLNTLNAQMTELRKNLAGKDIIWPL